MSYCRFSDRSDVYLWPSIQGGIECTACMLSPMEHGLSDSGRYTWEMHGTVTFDTNQEALSHLFEHRKAGHQVPQYAIDSLREEIAMGETAGDEA